jgi:hypothetical protein
MFHRDALRGVVGEVVALLEQHLVLAFDAGPGRHLLGHPGREGLVNGDWLEACQSARPLAVALGSHQVRIRRALRAWCTGLALGTGLGRLLSVGVAEHQHHGDREKKPNPLARSDHGFPPFEARGETVMRRGEKRSPGADLDRATGQLRRAPRSFVFSKAPVSTFNLTNPTSSPAPTP